MRTPRCCSPTSSVSPSGPAIRTPDELVQFLNRLYTRLRRAWSTSHGLEKIKISGDSYMVVSGVPEPRPITSRRWRDFALDMAEAVAGLHGSAVASARAAADRAWPAGPVVAGVVGTRRFFYDVWGDAVNVASRMESTDSVAGSRCQKYVHGRLKDHFVLEERGEVAVKGKGVMRTWFLIGERDRQSGADAR